jgi:Zn-dependent peptidase ImmA (M78 family)/DNA-binding XRE family transcriptional regulator
MDNPKFNGERLRNARIYRGMSLADLSTKIKISKQALSQYETGQIEEPEMDNLIALSQILKFPIAYFTTKQTLELKTGATFFRSLLSTSKIDRNAQNKRLEFVAQIYSTLFKFIDFPKLNLPTFKKLDSDLSKKDSIEIIANELRAYWKLGNEPIEDLKYTLEENGIIVIRTDPKTEEIDAFNEKVTINKEDMFFIAVATNQNYVRSRFDMAHELGHIILHQWVEDIETLSREEFKEIEDEANLFASAFLLPKSSFGQDVCFRANDLKYYEYLKEKWGVSIQAMVMRANSLGVISIYQYQTLWRQMAFRGYKTKEPFDRPYGNDNNLLKEAIELSIKEEQLTPAELIREFNNNGIYMEIEDIENLIGLDKNTLISLKPQAQIIKLKFN